MLVFNHVSTAYVNANMKPYSIVPEDIQPYAGKEDFEIEIKKILDTDPATLENNESSFMNNHNNTYVFCKDLAERYL